MLGFENQNRQNSTGQKHILEIRFLSQKVRINENNGVDKPQSNIFGELRFVITVQNQTKHEGKQGNESKKCQKVMFGEKIDKRIRQHQQRGTHIDMVGEQNALTNLAALRW